MVDPESSPTGHFQIAKSGLERSLGASREWGPTALTLLGSLTNKVKQNFDIFYGYPVGVTEQPVDVLGQIASGALDTIEPDKDTKPEFKEFLEIVKAETRYKKLTGPRGSNDGGWYEDSEGNKNYVKLYSDPSRSGVEYIACKVYEALGIPVPSVKLDDIDGVRAIVSREIKGASSISPVEMAAEPNVLRGFVADAFLANRDVTGNIFDNIIKGEDGVYYRVDNGGSLVYRARGALKEYPEDKIEELDSMRNPRYPSGMVFSQLTPGQIESQARHLVENLSPEKIDEIVDSANLENPDLVFQLKKALKGRRNYLADKFRRADIPADYIKPIERDNLDLESIGSPEILGQWDQAFIETICGARFRGPLTEIDLARNQAILVKVPEALSGKILDNLTLKHRKAERYRGSIGSDRWDTEGAYTRVLVFDKKTKRWVGWNGDISSGDKFAEPRPESSPEVEILYDWINKAGEIHPGYIMVIGAGKGPNGIVSFQEVGFETFPEDQTTKMQAIFSPGTRFVDRQKGILKPTYGGGEHPNMGIYPGSIPLNHPDISRLRFPITLKGDGFDLSQSRSGQTGDLRIRILKPIPMERLELAIGDTEDKHGVVYKRGETFRRGWSRLSAIVRSQDGRMHRVMDRMSVPPRGILKGSPEEKLYLKAGDEIILTSENDAAYLMGFRVQ